MLGGTESVCEEATLIGGSGRGGTVTDDPDIVILSIAVLLLVSRIESRIPPLRSLVRGRSNSGIGLGGGGGAVIFSGIACCEWARKDSDVSHR